MLGMILTAPSPCRQNREIHETTWQEPVLTPAKNAGIPAPGNEPPGCNINHISRALARFSTNQAHFVVKRKSSLVGRGAFRIAFRIACVERHLGSAAGNTAGLNWRRSLRDVVSVDLENLGSRA